MPLNTTNLISTPNITGDISSCQTVATIIKGASRPNIFILNDVGYMTNNCTGQTDIYHSWELSEFSTNSMWFIASVIVIVLIYKLFFK